MECPVCEYPKSEARFSLPDRFFETTDELFQLHCCPSCGLLFQDHEAVEARLSDFYPSSYWWREEGRAGSLEGRYRLWVVRHDQISFLKKVCPQPEGLKLLDIGCGGGLFVRLALESGFDAFGLERSRTALGLAGPDIAARLLDSEIDELAGQGQGFDVITMFHTLEHITDPFRYLKRIQKLFRRPGNLIVQVPNLRSLQARFFGSRWYGLDCPRHVSNFTEFALLHLLGRCGYRIQRVRHFSLRDNAASIVSSALPGLDPMSQRVKRTRRQGKAAPTAGTVTRDILYATLLVAIQPLAWLESRIKRGGTLTVHATLE